MGRIVFSSLLALGLSGWAATASADDVRDLPSRIGVVPSIGTGFAKVGSASPFPDTIGLTTLGIELHAEVPPYGGFFRFQFNSSGKDGRWTAPSFTLGGSYRFFGNGVDQFALLGRVGLLYERWHATNGNCPVDFFAPSNCKALVPPSPQGVIQNIPPIVTYTGDQFGVMAGARLELPVRIFYAAIDAELGGVAEVGDPSPGAVFHGRLALVAAFRDARTPGHAEEERRRVRERPRKGQLSPLPGFDQRTGM